MTTMPTPAVLHGGHATQRLIALPIGLALIVSTLLLAFAWPAVTADVRSLPIAVAGPAEQVAHVVDGLEQNKPGAFEVVTVDDRAAAVELIETREVYGAIVLGAEPEVLTASAASPAAAQLLSALASQLSAQLNAAAAAQGIALPAPIVVATTDVVALPDTDPRGAGLISASFPMVLGGIIAGSALSLLVVGVWRRMAVLGAFAVIAGLSLAAILQGLFGALDGNYVVNSAAIALALTAVGAVVVGLSSLVGRSGIILSVVLFVLFANPLSAATQPAEFIVAPWGAIGQWMPPGAGATLLRDVSYFPGADASFAWLVLAGWAIAGVALAALSSLTVAKRASMPTAESAVA
jgi:hypothetical protein